MLGTISRGIDVALSLPKVHLIIQHLNRRTGRVQEKHLKEPPMIRSTKLTSLYTLIVRPDGSFEIRINREVVRTGHLHTDFDPPLNSPAEIDDPEDVKPDYWVDEERYRGHTLPTRSNHFPGYPIRRPSSPSTGTRSCPPLSRTARRGSLTDG